MDPIQQYFVDWYVNNNTNSLRKAQGTLYPIIKRKVSKFFKGVNEEDLEDIFHEPLELMILVRAVKDVDDDPSVPGPRLSPAPGAELEHDP